MSSILTRFINRLLDSIKESYLSVIPIIFIVIVVGIIMKISIISIFSFILSGVFVMIGVSLFTFGANVSMISIGRKIGTSLVKSGKLGIIIIVTMIIGTIITIAEPDLMVLTKQLPDIPSLLLMLAVGIGVGLFFMVATLKNIYRLNLNRILIISYLVVFILMFLVPNDFVAIGFDSGGVTTGPISVPFILSLGLGVNALRTDKNAKKDSFGLVALSSVGPIIIVLILGLFFKTSNSYEVSSYIINGSLIDKYWITFLSSLKSVTLSMLPIICVTLIYIIKFKNIIKREIIKIFVGFFLAISGMTIFLTGANVGFINMGYLLGSGIGNLSYKYIIIPFGMLIGFLIVKAEPGIKILNEQVEKLTEGSIKKESVSNCLSVGVAFAIGIALLRALTGISIIYFLLPGYLIAIIMSFFVNRMFTGIAFDSGGAVTGPLTVTFLLPMSIGICYINGGNVMSDAFGLIALVALIPLITIQGLGLIYKYKSRILKTYDDYDDTINVYNWGVK